METHLYLYLLAKWGSKTANGGLTPACTRLASLHSATLRSATRAGEAERWAAAAHER